MHIDPVELIDYARGTLRPRRAETVRQHCAACSDCGGQLAAVLLVREAHGVDTPPRAVGAGSVLAAAAALVLAVALVAWAAFGPAGTGEPAVTGAGASEGAVGEPVVTALPESLRGGLATVLWSIQKDVGLALPASATGANDAILKAADHLREDDPGAAIDALERHAGATDLRVDLLLGIGYLMRGDATAAGEALDRIALPAEVVSESYVIYRRTAQLFRAEVRVQDGEERAAVALLSSLAGEFDGQSDWIGDAARERLAELAAVPSGLPDAAADEASSR